MSGTAINWVSLPNFGATWGAAQDAGLASAVQRRELEQGRAFDNALTQYAVTLGSDDPAARRNALAAIAASGGLGARFAIPQLQRERETSLVEGALPQLSALLGGGGMAAPALAAPAVPMAPSGSVTPTAAGGSYLGNLLAQESGGRDDAANPRSTARGAGQFLNGTWLSLLRQERPDLAGRPDAELLAMRGNGDLSRQMVLAYARRNADYLQSAGLPVNDTTIGLSHFLGPQGARTVLSAAPETTLDSLFPASVIAANPNLRGMTAGGLLASQQRRYGTGTTFRGADGPRADAGAAARYPGAVAVAGEAVPAGAPTALVETQVGGDTVLSAVPAEAPLPGPQPRDMRRYTAEETRRARDAAIAQGYNPAAASPRLTRAQGEALARDLRANPLSAVPGAATPQELADAQLRADLAADPHADRDPAQRLWTPPAGTTMLPPVRVTARPPAAPARPGAATPEAGLTADALNGEVLAALAGNPATTASGRRIAGVVSPSPEQVAAVAQRVAAAPDPQAALGALAQTGENGQWIAAAVAPMLAQPAQPPVPQSQPAPTSAAAPPNSLLATRAAAQEAAAQQQAAALAQGVAAQPNRTAAAMALLVRLQTGGGEMGQRVAALLAPMLAHQNPDYTITEVDGQRVMIDQRNPLNRVVLGRAGGDETVIVPDPASSTGFRYARRSEAGQGGMAAPAPEGYRPNQGGYDVGDARADLERLAPRVRGGQATEVEVRRYLSAQNALQQRRYNNDGTYVDPTLPAYAPGVDEVLRQYGERYGITPMLAPPPAAALATPGGANPGTPPAAAGGTPGTPIGTTGLTADPPLPTARGGVGGTPSIAPSAADRSKLREIEVNAQGIRDALTTFRETRGRAGLLERGFTAAGVPTELNTTWTNAALLAKGEALYNLGVLNGSDLAILRRALSDPSTLRGFFTGQATAEAQVAAIERLLDQRLAAARAQYGGQSAPPAAPSPRPAGDRAPLSSFQR